MSKKKNDIYTKVLLNEKLYVKFEEVNSNIIDVLENIIKKKVEGKCIDNGYVKKDSVKIVSYSSGELISNNVLFEIIYECLICNPVESMKIDCVVKNITKAGIRAELTESPSPLIIFIARDHNYQNEYFSQIQLDDVVNVSILGKRFEINDIFISIIGELTNIDKYKTSVDKLKS